MKRYFEEAKGTSEREKWHKFGTLFFGVNGVISGFWKTVSNEQERSLRYIL